MTTSIGGIQPFTHATAGLSGQNPFQAKFSGNIPDAGADTFEGPSGNQPALVTGTLLTLGILIGGLYLSRFVGRNLVMPLVRKAWPYVGQAFAKLKVWAGQGAAILKEKATAAAANVTKATAKVPPDAVA